MLPVNDNADSAYPFFPYRHNSEWLYQVTSLNAAGDTLSEYEMKSVRNNKTARIENFKDGQLSSYMYWWNEANRLFCCNHRILMDYGQLGCTDSMVRIYLYERPNVNLKIYQYCQKKFATMVTAFNDVECIKTFQQNDFPDSSALEIVQYFGNGVGLVYRLQVEYDSNGKLLTEEHQKLKSFEY